MRPRGNGSPAVLAGTQGMLSGQSYAITAEGLSIGREAGCDIALEGDSDVSREHAGVPAHPAVWAQDAGSRNGVFVNGKRLMRPKQVGPGDRLTVGTHEFTVELRRPEGTTRPPISPWCPRACRRRLRRAPVPKRTRRWIVHADGCTGPDRGRGLRCARVVAHRRMTGPALGHRSPAVRDRSRAVGPGRTGWLRRARAVRFGYPRPSE